MDGGTNHTGGPAATARPEALPDGDAAPHDAAAARAPAAAAGLPEWDCAVGREAACLRATARRYRVRARNPARAALQALRRHGLDGQQARDGGVWIAVHLLPEAHRPRAIFALAGTADAPTLELRAADLLPPASPLLGAGGPFDAAALAREVPRVARRRAQAQVGSSGLGELLRGAFWQREATLYSSTAMVLAAFGFPMSAEVFAVGGVLLLIQGAARLIVREGRIAAAATRLRRDPALAGTLQALAVRTLYARAHAIEGPDGAPLPCVLRDGAAVPDLRGETRIRQLIDEDCPVTTGPAADVPGREADGAAEDAPTPPASDNVLTIVFRRPRRAARASPAAACADAPAPRRGGANLPMPAAPTASAEDEIEVIDAELLDPDPDDRPSRDWWA